MLTGHIRPSLPPLGMRPALPLRKGRVEQATPTTQPSRFLPLAGAERSSALQRAILSMVMPTHRRHFVRGRLQPQTSSAYRRTKNFEGGRRA
jgi:hypothetical protein